MQIYPIIHISLLEPTENLAAEEDLNIQEYGNKYKVKEILDYMKINSQSSYLIEWKGYDKSENIWEPMKNLNCQQKIEKFHRRRGHN